MNNKARFIGSLTTVTLVGVGAVAAAMPASAADPEKNSQGQCLASPSYWNTTHHDEVSHTETTVTPGIEEVSHEEQRWSREVPGVEEISHVETKFMRTIPGVAELSHEQWRYFDFIPAVQEITHTEGQFSRENPGQQEQSHTEGQFSRSNPGQQEQSHQEYKYSKQVPPTIETKYKKPVVKTEYQYQKSVKGVVQVKNGNHWVNTGDTFDWEIWRDTLTKWSFNNTDVLEAGGHSAVQSEWTEGNKQYRKLTTNYQYVKNGVTREVPTGEFTYEWFTSNPGSPWVSTGTTREKTPGSTLYYNNGNWTTDVNPAGWTKIDERTVIDQEAIAPYTEYRAQDGSATTDVNNAGWFPETSVEGWSPYGTRKTVIDQEAVPARTLYLTRDSLGNLGQSENRDDAFWFTSSDGIDPKWVEFDRVRIIDRPAIPERTVYLAGILGAIINESDDPKRALWLVPNHPLVNLAIWQQMVDEFGNPLTRTVVDQEAVDGYTEYYVPGGEPTRELGESNWTTDEPEGWSFVDNRKVVDQEAVLPVVTTVKVVDKAAWDEKTYVPAEYEVCTLAATGSDPWGPVSLAALLMLGGTAGVIWARRGRHVADAA